MPTIRLNKGIAMKSMRLKKNLLSHLPKAKTVEGGALTELTEVQKLFRENRSRASLQKKQVTNSEHYIVLCFGSAERKEEFASAMKITLEERKFADGEALATTLGIRLSEMPKLVSAPRHPMKTVPLIRSLPNPENDQ